MSTYSKVFLFLVSCCLLLTSAPPAAALYDPRSVPNNKAGVHILHPSELEEAAKLVNAHGGDWGYVTIPIQPTDRDHTKWQQFFDRCRELHIIPIVRIMTVPLGGTWATAQDTDLVDFANFLNELHWPVENRYIVLFNEVNRATEWGGKVDPELYVKIVKNARTIFKERSSDYFLLGPALDNALPNSNSSMSADRYLAAMTEADPSIWSYFDGLADHSYPNPGFAASPDKTGLQSVTSYATLLARYRLADKPVFITETGWDQTKLGTEKLITYWSRAWSKWYADPRVAAVTPFVLRGGEAYAVFSLQTESGELTASGRALAELTKTKGEPHLGVAPSAPPAPTYGETADLSRSFFKAGRALLNLENIFRVILGLPTKAYVTLGEKKLVVEVAGTPSQWEKGLSDRKELGAVDGMLFNFTSSHIPIFWMKNMHFPLDIIWIESGSVVDMATDVQPGSGDNLPTYSPKVPVDMVLEVPAGWASSNNIQVGATLSVLD
jgi:hypothetical protein